MGSVQLSGRFSGPAAISMPAAAGMLSSIRRALDRVASQAPWDRGGRPTA
ncbi:MAG: hypothetical protein GY859_34225 [Desulfobacterales bacterium]|nr:hypothetical protein [Desulfobacterales bacterium]